MKTVIISGAVTTVILLGLGALGLLVWQMVFAVPVAPQLTGSSPTLPAPTLAFLPSTVTPIPTYAYRPTSTPIATVTPFPFSRDYVKPPEYGSSPLEQPSVGQPPVSQPGSNCAPQLEYAASVHEYELDMIDYIYSPLVQFHESLIEQASRERDALGLVQAQRELKAVRNEMQARVRQENKRYNAEVAAIRAAYC